MYILHKENSENHKKYITLRIIHSISENSGCHFVNKTTTFAAKMEVMYEQNQFYRAEGKLVTEPEKFTIMLSNSSDNVSFGEINYEAE